MSTISNIYQHYQTVKKSVGSFVDPFLPQLSNSLFKGFLWFSVPADLYFITTSVSLSLCIVLMR